MAVGTTVGVWCSSTESNPKDSGLCDSSAGARAAAAVAALRDFGQALAAGEIQLTPLEFSALNTLVSVVGVVPGPAAVLATSAGISFGVVRGTALYLASAVAGVAVSMVLARAYVAAGKQKKQQRQQVPGASAAAAAADSNDDAAGPFAVAAFLDAPFQMTALARLSPVVPFSLANFILGAMPLPVLQYLAASAVGLVGSSFVFVYAGAAGADAAQGNSSQMQNVLNVVGLLATAYVTKTVVSKMNASEGARKDD